MIQIMTVGALLFIVVATSPQTQALREAKLAKLEAEREASTRAYDEWVSQQNLIEEQYQQEEEMLATGSVGSIPVESVEWLKYKCACHKGQFSVKQDPNWGDGYFILYCEGVAK